MQLRKARHISLSGNHYCPLRAQFSSRRDQAAGLESDHWCLLINNTTPRLHRARQSAYQSPWMKARAILRIQRTLHTGHANTLRCFFRAE